MSIDEDDDVVDSNCDEYDKDDEDDSCAVSSNRKHEKGKYRGRKSNSQSTIFKKKIWILYFLVNAY